MNRVVITGYGVTSPIGNEPETFLESLKTGKNGIGPISKFDVSETGVTLAAEVKDFPMEKYLKKMANAWISFRYLAFMRP